MCGITGIFDYSGRIQNLRFVGERMLNTLRHRGPDAGDCWLSSADGLLLGHRRLAIQDLSALGAQPMFSKSNRYCVVFNGEIYNFQEIASTLVKQGSVFRGHSDTEVLLEAIDCWGLVPALKYFTGMFAFALWDTKEKVLHLCRDRLGEKPLYFGCIEGAFYFASELRAIEAVVDRNALAIDKSALNAFLRYGYINAPLSIYQQIAKLMPGSLLTIRQQDLISGQVAAPEVYWCARTVADAGLAAPILSEDDAVNGLDDLLSQTIRRQLIADVAVGAFLSGGVDSALVSALAQKESNGQIKTFTIGFHEKEYDESVYAKKVAEHIGSDHHEVFVSSADALDVIPSLAQIFDEPFADSSQIPMFLVSKIAKQEVTVCLSGDGGDELFAGYNRYTWLKEIWAKVGSMPFPIRKLVGYLLSLPSPILWDKLYRILSFSPGSTTNYKLLGLKLQKLAGLFAQPDILAGYDYLSSYWNQPGQLLSREFQATFTSRPKEFPVNAEFMDQAMYWDQVSYLPGDNLVKVDRASMNVSLETRLPLLSHEVFEYAWRLPVATKVSGHIGKQPLRKVLDRYVPRQLIDRPKMGFSVPVASWLRHDLKEWAHDILFNPAVAEGEIFDKNVLEKIWDEHQTGRCDHSQRLWVILMFVSWRERP